MCIVKRNLLKWVFIKVSYGGLQCTPSESLFPCSRKILPSKPIEYITKEQKDLNYTWKSLD
jgi:hypothetical protein